MRCYTQVEAADNNRQHNPLDARRHILTLLGSQVFLFHRPNKKDNMKILKYDVVCHAIFIELVYIN